ncbi:MAG: GNAT family N-acetyltransferase [Clostridiales bacterium]|nr:GNAT family N-acetyltransferase [Clostridiales bacterium]
MQPITLRKMTEEEFIYWNEWSLSSYAKSLVTAGQCTESGARAQAESDFSAALKDGLSTQNHHILIAENAENIPIGMLWYETENPTHAYIADLAIYAAYQRMGYGQAILSELERILTQDGIPVIVLHVFTHNTAAIKLYEKCGYSAMQVDQAEEGSLYMKKVLQASAPYKNCPVYETEHFTLRLISDADADDLFVCYSDVKAWDIFNADRCTSDFRYTTREQMTQCLRDWLYCYENGYFIRFSIIDKSTKKAVGTIEMFGDSTFLDGKSGGVLRIDLASPYEIEQQIGELLATANHHFFTLFNVKTILTKAIPAATERRAALLAAGYKPFAWEAGREHYFMKRVKETDV